MAFVSSKIEKMTRKGNHFRIVGGNRLDGTITISGSKNAALPLMCACLLTDSPVRIGNVPTTLSDCSALAGMLRKLGAAVDFIEGDTGVTLHAREIVTGKVDDELGRKMRASVLLLGPLLARHGSADVPLPGGCPIGARPVDFHLRGLQAMGADVRVEGDWILASAPPGGLRGAVVEFPRVSVGATGNLMMAACLADGTTTLTKAAQEPEIINLGELLINMGASIQGLGTPTIVIHGKAQLHGTPGVHQNIPDRLETATWMMGCCMTRGALLLKNTRIDHLESVLQPLQQAGLCIEEEASSGDISVHFPSPRLQLSSTDITTEPYPGFPTDLQAPFMALLSLCEGTNTVTEKMFENRFMHVQELLQFGAIIQVHGTSATVEGVPFLRGGVDVTATDLRAGAALVLAALAAVGETRVFGIHHLDRGYEKMVEKLQACGACIKRINSP